MNADALLYVASVGLGGGLGSVVRAIISERFDANAHNLPCGTFVANMLASLLLGAIYAGVRLGVFHACAGLFLSAGFCASLSTFSTLAGQIVLLAKQKRRRASAGYALLTFAGGLILFYLGDLLFSMLAL